LPPGGRFPPRPGGSSIALHRFPCSLSDAEQALGPAFVNGRIWALPSGDPHTKRHRDDGATAPGGCGRREIKRILPFSPFYLDKSREIGYSTREFFYGHF
jgi:hypothetical protein